MKRILQVIVTVALAGLVLVTGTGAQEYYRGRFVGGTLTSPTLASDGTALLPAYSFASEPTLGFWRSSAGNGTWQGVWNATGVISSASSVAVGSASSFQMTSRATVSAPAVGVVNFQNWAATIGAQFKVDALPVASACGAGSPAVVAGSTPFSGSVTVGTGAPATCTITFGGTAYPSAPHCSGAVETTTAANARAMGYSATTTVLTIVPATAWADSSVVNWGCVSSK